MRKEWAADLVHVWVAAVKQNMAINEFVKTDLCFVRRRLYGRFKG